MPPAPQQQQSDSSMGPVWIVVGIFIAGAILWAAFHTQIVSFIMKFRLLEMNLIGLFTNSLAADAEAIRKATPAEFAALTYYDVLNVSGLVGNYLRYPALLLLSLMAVVLYLGSNTSRFKKIYSMQRLIDMEREQWPQITPVTKLDLVAQHIDKGPWAMAMTPMQFAKYYNLLQEERIVNVGGNLRSIKDKSKITVSLLKGEAHKTFTLQLGNYWSGPNNLNIHTRALFAVFAARANRDKDGADKLLAQIAASAKGDGKLNFAGVDELLDKHKNIKAVVKVTQKHAFVLTVMASMIELGREDGVIAAADFLWLKPVDRRLWFMLNTVGRQTPFVEIAGAFAHWLAEKAMGRKLNVPMVDEAVKALDLAIQDTLYIPDNPEDK